MPGLVKSKILFATSRHIRTYVQHRRLTLPMVGIKMCMHLLYLISAVVYVCT